jgi:nucleoside-diphosphate-sugar epimerase
LTQTDAKTGAKTWNVLVTGGAGYVGAVLVPGLLAAGHKVTVLDLYLYGDDVLDAVKDAPGLRQIKGDLRDPATVERALDGCDAVIHLACISNDPSFELNPELGKSINLDAFRPLVRAAKAAGVKRFIYASSSSVYGIKEGVEVTEDLPLEPLTDYSRFKADCEKILDEERAPGFVTLTVRPATVCGYSPRQRLDVIVNILTNHAVSTGRIKVTGGPQKRPNIHIGDMCRFYLAALQWDDDAIDGKVYNVGEKNHTVSALAGIVRDVVRDAGGTDVAIDVLPTNDPRSYHVSSERIKAELGFEPQFTIAGAVADLAAALRAGTLPDSLENPRYFNIKMMQLRNLQ